MTKFLTKCSSVAGKVPAAADLVQRELAVNTADALLYMLNSAGTVTNLNPPPFQIFNGATVYKSNVTVRYSNSGTTDSNGRIAFNITKDATSTGTAIFSKVLSINATAMASGTANVGQYPYAVIESVTAKIVTVRLLTGISALLSLGPTVQYAGSGVTCYLEVAGLP